MTSPTLIRVYPRRRIEVSRASADITTGNPLKLACSSVLSSNPTRSSTTIPDLPVTWSWSFQDTKLPEIFKSGRVWSNASSTELWVEKSARLDHEGIYVCQLSTALETVSSEPIRVNVFDPPKLVSSPRSLRLVRGQSGQLGKQTFKTPNLWTLQTTVTLTDLIRS